MGKPSSNGVDTARLLGGTLASATASGAYPASNYFNISIWGTFVGTVKIERSFDGGTTWIPLSYNGSVVTFTAAGTETFFEPEHGMLYRFNCTAYTSGTINYRLSQ